MAIISDNADGILVSIHVASTSLPEVTALAEATISECFITDEKPERLVVGDKAYDR
jgi:hypothetical protein